jgi:SagB-type dehydrogenase family enzyme
MRMYPFSDPLAGINGLKPGGWRQEGHGLWISAGNEALLFQRGMPNMTTEQIKTGLMVMLGLPKPKERISDLRSDSFKWDLYHMETKDETGQPLIVQTALTQVGKWAYVVTLAALATDYELLHKSVFLPALTKLTPLYTGADAVRVAKERAKKYKDTIQNLREIMKEDLSIEADWISDQMKGLAMPPSQKDYDPAVELISLPKPDQSVLIKPNILTCIADRKSRRKFNEENLTLAELAYLLWATQGIRHGRSGERHYRTVPSAGSRHSFETYLVIQHVEGLKAGIYRYLPFDHKLVFLFTTDDLPQKLTALASMQPFVGNSAACFIWSTIPYRMEWRYGSSSQRVILMDVGHVCQNLYLAAESIGCGTCGIAAYHQDELDKFLGLDGKDEFVIYLAPVGKVGPGQEE